MSQSEFIYTGENSATMCFFLLPQICLLAYISIQSFQKMSSRHVLIIILLVQLANLSMSLVQDLKLIFCIWYGIKIKSAKLALYKTLTHNNKELHHIYMRKSITIICTLNHMYSFLYMMFFQSQKLGLHILIFVYMIQTEQSSFEQHINMKFPNKKE